jgi:hypothetical protein
LRPGAGALEGSGAGAFEGRGVSEPGPLRVWRVWRPEGLEAGGFGGRRVWRPEY